MKEYENMENNALDALDAFGIPDVIIVNKEQEYKAASQKKGIIYQLKIGIKRD